MHLSDFNTPSKYLICRWLLTMMLENHRKCSNTLSKGNEDAQSFCTTGLAGEILTDLGIGQWQMRGGDDDLNRLGLKGDDGYAFHYETGLPRLVNELFGFDVEIDRSLAERHWPLGNELPYLLEHRSKMSINSFLVVLNDETALSFPEIAHTAHGLYVGTDELDVPAYLMRYVTVAMDHGLEHALHEAGIESPHANSDHPIFEREVVGA